MLVMHKTLNVSALCQKSYSSVEWEQLNPVLLTGEFGYDTDKDDFKIGDGVTSWSDLPYFKETTLSEEQVDLNDYDWQDMGGTYEATKYISGIDYDSMIWYSAETNSLEDFADAGVVMTEQGYGQVTFSCKEKPQNQISVLVRWQ
jgi:hypothetical protein